MSEVQSTLMDRVSEWKDKGYKVYTVTIGLLQVYYRIPLPTELTKIRDNTIESYTGLDDQSQSDLINNPDIVAQHTEKLQANLERDICKACIIGLLDENDNEVELTDENVPPGLYGTLAQMILLTGGYQAASTPREL